ncbi:hypothetical protein OH77DRAFT_1428961, partial [Trametes cingulata]
MSPTCFDHVSEKIYEGLHFSLQFPPWVLGLCGLGNSGVPDSESKYGLEKSGVTERSWSGVKRTKSGVEETRSGVRSTHGGGLLRGYWQRTGSRLSVLNLEADGDVGVRSTGVRTRSSERRIGKNGDETETRFRIGRSSEFGGRRSEVGQGVQERGYGLIVFEYNKE